jgi:hypothetical protein
MPKWVQMGYYWVIGFNPLGSGLGWVIEGGTQNPMGWVLGRRLRPKMGSAEVYRAHTKYTKYTFLYIILNYRVKCNLSEPFIYGPHTVSISKTQEKPFCGNLEEG